MEVEIVIDKAVVIGRITPSFEYYINRLGNLFVKEHGFAKYPYHDYWTFQDGSFLQLGQVKNGDLRPQYRLEFNPAKCDWKELHKLIMTLEWGRFSRIDIACDYKGVDLSEVRWTEDTNSRKTNTYRSCTGRLETLYIGSRQSSCMWRIYDKQKEREAKGEAIQGEWWRVEAELKFKDNDGDFIRTIFLDPFQGLVGYAGLGLGANDWETQAKLDYLIKNPHVMSSWTAPTRRKYRKLLNDNSTLLNPQPSEVWEKEKVQVRQHLNLIEKSFSVPRLNSIPQMDLNNLPPRETPPEGKLDINMVNEIKARLGAR